MRCIVSLRRMLCSVVAMSVGLGTGVASDDAVRVQRVGSAVEIQQDAASGSRGQLDRFVYFSPDAKTLLIIRAGNDRKYAGIWDVETGRPISPRLKHRAVIFDAAISGDGTMAVIAGLKSSYLWNTKTGERIGPPLPQGRRRTRGVAISPSGETILTDGRWLWDVKTGKRLAVTLEHPERTYSVHNAAFSPDGSKILTGAESGTVQLWDAMTGAAIGPPLKHRQAVRHVSFSPDGKLVAVAYRDGMGQLQPLPQRTLRNGVVRIWNPRTGKLLASLSGHHGDVYQTAWSPNGKLLLTGGWDATARLWDVATGQQLTTSIPHERAVRAVCFAPDGQTFLTWNFNRLQRWATPSSVTPKK
ncbi:MAG: WD40 repeat domain-containing protein [Planctomycetaceae bacterium]|nr:WD40 repeat domain-containing protein [Planctomycetaceae bacterium]